MLFLESVVKKENIGEAEYKDIMTDTEFSRNV